MFFRLTKRQRKAHFDMHKAAACKLIVERVAHYNAFYNFTYGRITVRNQKTRWGSCSKSGNLSFNYRVGLVAPELMDYVVVHELCHLGQFNHSKDFWDLVAQTIPDHKRRRATLKKIRI